MGIVNNDILTLGSGLQIPNCYLSFTPGPLPFPYQPPPMTFQWTAAADGTKSYVATATLYIYSSKEGKDAGLAPIEQRSVSIPAAASSAMVGGVFDVFFTYLKALYTNTTDDPAMVVPGSLSDPDSKPIPVPST